MKHWSCLASVWLGVLGCGAEPAIDDAGGSTAATTSVADPAAVPPAPVPELGDPFAGIEPLRPDPWTGWPLENIDIEIETGWRIDPASGQFELERGLVLAAEPKAFVLSIAPGEVVELRREPDTTDTLELVIRHADGIESRYGPLVDSLVHVGLPVARGSAIGLAQGPTLRLIVTVDGVAIDPLSVLRQAI